MTALTSNAVVVATVGLVLLCIRIYQNRSDSRQRSRPGRYPPGPPGLPVVGSLFDLVKDVPIWEAYNGLCAMYGNMVFFRILHNRFLIINNADLAFELLEKRSTIYSSRPSSALFSLTGFEWSFAFFPYGQRWRRYRRVFWQYFNPTAIRTLEPAQNEGARRLLSLLTRHSSVDAYIKTAIVATVFRAAYGLDVADENDSKIAISEKASSTGDIFVEGSLLLECFPWLARLVPLWLPGTHTLRRLAEGRKAAHELREVPWGLAKTDVDRGNSQTSIASVMLEKLSRLDPHVALEEEDVAMSALGTVYGAGIDTMHASMQSFFVACILHPEVQHKAQAELDAVVGPDRLPTLADRASLPFVNAILKEMMRWHVVVPINLARATSTDDEYGGFHIPADTTVLVNAWAILHDPAVYPKPEEFIPERFLKDGQLDPNVRDPSTIAFGFGRRICPGRYFADATLFLLVASVLHVFTISAPLDTDGREIPIKPRVTSSLVSNLEGWDCIVKPRSAAALALIRRETQIDDEAERR